MINGPDAQRIKTQLLIWWIIWAAVLFGLIALYFFLGQVQARPLVKGGHPLIGLVGVVPLFVSIVIRWLALPRARDLTRALPMFVVGLALAEAGGIMGLFLGGPFRDDVFLLGVFGVVQFIPIFARRIAEQKPAEFIPNN